jgi:hypothetical protein
MSTLRLPNSEFRESKVIFGKFGWETAQQVTALIQRRRFLIWTRPEMAKDLELLMVAVKDKGS